MANNASRLFEMMLCMATGTVVWIFIRRQHQRDIEELRRQWSQKRLEERRGRIRAEVSLRKILQQNSSAITSEHGKASGDSTMTFPLKRIGTISSPYTKRMGTPRQPGLVPASRGCIDLDKGIQSALFDGIEEYSHIWILFRFHANTDTNLSQKTKIRPPRGHGIKVGQLATRSPHRPNPIGLSMVRLERREPRRLLISGHDLVHSTPVYDIKPVVPWDMVSNGQLHVPAWVTSTGDVLPVVEFAEDALKGLRSAVERGLFGDLYPPSNDGLIAARDTIQQILEQDPRSSHRGLKQNARGNLDGNSNYHLTFGHTRVTFRVCKSVVHVLEISEQTFSESQYVDGIPIVLEGLF